ncbi:MAG TPA: VanZ family protein [Candidatus Binatia bacterium]|jgi:VanZ family protein
MTRAQIITFRLILVAALMVITHLATTPQQYPVFKHIFDKANHILAFYFLALLMDFSFPKTNLGISKVMGLLTYGILIEVVQGFIPNRMPSLLDLVADGIGIASYRLSMPVLRHVPLLSGRWRVQT